MIPTAGTTPKLPPSRIILDTFNPIDFEVGNELHSDNCDQKSFAYNLVDISLIVISYTQILSIGARNHEL